MPRTARSWTIASSIAAAVAFLMLSSQAESLGFNISALAGVLLVAIFWIAIVGGGIWLAVEFFGVINSRKIGINDDAISVLRNRYAKGEVSRAEYFQMMQDLELDRE